MPDYVDLNKDSLTLKVLYDAHQMLMEQVEHDATPEFLDELKSKICAGYTEESHPSIENLAKLFQDKDLNPFSFPFGYLLNGTLPQQLVAEHHDAPAVQILQEDFDLSNDKKDSPNENLNVKSQVVKKKVSSTPKKLTG